MIWSAGDLGIEIDFGLLYKEPGAILQRKEKDFWYDYLVDGESVVNPFDVETLQPRQYRLTKVGWQKRLLIVQPFQPQWLLVAKLELASLCF